MGPVESDRAFTPSRHAGIDGMRAHCSDVLPGIVDDIQDAKGAFDWAAQFELREVGPADDRLTLVAEESGRIASSTVPLRNLCITTGGSQAY